MHKESHEVPYKTVVFFPRYYKLRIPNDWNVTESQKMIRISRGMSYTSNEINQEGIGNVLINLNCFNKKGSFNKNGIKYYTGNGNTSSLVQENDILIANTDVTREGNIIGYPILVPNLGSNDLCYYSMDASKIDIIDKELSKPFLYYFLLSNISHNCMKAFSAGTTVLHLDISSIKKTKIIYPALKEQNKIISLFSKTDKLIQKTDQIIEQAHRLKKGLVQRLLTKGISHTKFKKTQIGEIPDSWRLNTTADIIAYVTSGSRDWAKYYSDSGPILIRIANLDHDSINLDLRTTKHVSLPQGIEGIRTRIRPNDIIISITADVGMVAVIPTSFPEAYVNQHIALVRLKEGYNARFIARYISWNEGGLKQFIQMQRGVTKVGLGLNDIKNVIVPIPTLNEQQEIVSILDSVESALTINYQFKNMTKHLKRGLMQQILTGKIRVIV